MSEKEKNIITKIAHEFPKLDEKKQNYILGYVECLATLRDEQRDKELRET